MIPHDCLCCYILTSENHMFEIWCKENALKIFVFECSSLIITGELRGMKYWVVGFVVCTLQRATERRAVSSEGQTRKFSVAAFNADIRGTKLIKETKKQSAIWRHEIVHRRWRTFATNGNFFPTFRQNLSVPSSGLKNPKQESKILLDSWTLRIESIVESPKSRLLSLFGPLISANLTGECVCSLAWLFSDQTRHTSLRPTVRGGFLVNNVRVSCGPISTVLRVHLRSRRPPNSETWHSY